MKYSVFFPKSGYRVDVDAGTAKDACKKSLDRLRRIVEDFNPPDPFVLANDVTWYPPEGSYTLAEAFHVDNNKEVRQMFRLCECGGEWIEA